MAYIGKQPSDITRAIATYDTFTGDGSTATFDLTQAAASANDIVVVVNNVRQEPGSSKSYTLGLDGSGITKRVTFNVAPEAADDIYVVNPTQIEAIVRAGDISSGAITGQTELTVQRADDDLLLIYDTSAGVLKKIQASNVASDLDINATVDLGEEPAAADEFVIYDATAGANRKVAYSYINPTLTYSSGTATGDGSTTAFTISSGRSVQNTLVFVNGFQLTPTTDYTISGTTLTFQTAPANPAEIAYRYLPIGGAYTSADFTGDGSTTTITIDAGRTVSDVLVVVNGLTLVPTDDYTISSTTLTFISAPANLAEITVRYLRLS
jgi:hypothetical protein